MKSSKTGATFFSAPVFLFCLLLLLGGLGRAAWAQEPQPILPQVPGNSMAAHQRVVVFADNLRYFEDTGKVLAEGHVRLWYGPMTLTAQSLDADLEAEMAYAQGDVTLAETERTIHCAELEYSLSDQSVRARGILFASHPWYYQGETVEKQGDKRVLIDHPLFTTCNARHPHYHIRAERIDILLGETLTAYNAVLYVGTTPLFYLPWIQRSIKDSRPPFSIRVGYNDYEGFYVRVKVSYYLAEKNYGDVLLNLMERKGLGLGLDHYLEYDLLGHGQANLSVLYVKDDQEGVERWTAKVQERHEITENDLLQLNWDYLSDHQFNRQFSSLLVDSFQQKSYLAYSHQDTEYYWGISAEDVETWDPETERYRPTLRYLPSVSFSRSALPMVKLVQPLYFGLSGNFNRSYEDISSIWFDRDEPPVSYRFEDNYDLTPRWTQTYALPIRTLTQPSLSGSLSLPMSGRTLERYFSEALAEEEHQNELNAAYTTQVTLTNKWVNYQRTTPTYLLQSRFTHEFTRKFSMLQTQVLPRAGVSAHKLRLALDYDMGRFLHLGGKSAYDLLSTAEDWRMRMESLTFDGRADPWERLSLNWQGTYHWLQDRVTSGNLGVNVSGDIWNASVYSSYSYRENHANPHAVFGTLNAGLNPRGLGLSLQGSTQYDFSLQQFTNFTLGVSRDLHCWQVQAAYKVYADGITEIGAGIQLKAFPQIQAGMGGAQSGLELGE